MTEENKSRNRINALHNANEVKFNKYTPKNVLQCYEKRDLLETAKAYHKKGELEQAYGTIYKFLSLVAYLFKIKDSIDWKTYAKKIGQDYQIAVELAEKWKGEIMGLPIIKDAANIGLTSEAVMANPILRKDITYNCTWLHKMLIENPLKLLIIDTRSINDYLESHVLEKKDVQIVNIPEDVIKEGVSAEAMGNSLPAAKKKLYDSRSEYEYVVLIHKESEAPALQTLHTALSKFDRHPYPNLIILAEGYIDWCEYYPHYIFGSLPTIDSEEKSKFNLENVIYNISFENDYADTQHYFSPIKFSGIPQFDRSKKPTEYRDSKKYDFTEKDEIRSKLEAEQSERWKLRKEREIEAERCQIIENEREEKLDREAKEKYEKTLEEECAREELQRRRKLKNIISETDRTNNTVENDQSGLNQRIDADRGTQAQSTSNSWSQSDLPKFDRGSKPRKSISKPVIGESPGLTGLKNLGNTCYMNSILQCISNNSSLARYFYESCFTNDINRKQQYRGEIADSVAKVIKALWAGKQRAVACHPLKTAIGFIKPEYKTCEQQDSHEFLTYLMDWLHYDLKKDVPLMIKNDEKSEIEKVWKDFKIKNESVIFALFYGLQRSTVECLECFERSSTYEPFSNLSLIIPEAHNVSLSDCLKLYLKGEPISGWRCPKCNFERKAKKTVDLCKLPNILVIHLKRFSFHDVSSKKRTTFVDFPIENLCLENTDGQSRSYDLFGVSNHYGTIEGGHYTAYCKNPQYNRWYKFDDHEVVDLSPSNVTTSAAYILFYSSPDKKQFRS